MTARHMRCGFARYFGTSAAFWMNMQAQFDLERAEDELGAELRR